MTQKKTAQELLDENVTPQVILDEALMKGMAVVGEKFRNNEMFVPQVLVSARAMKLVMTILEPYFTASSISKKGKIIIGTVKGDIHDIGKNLVSIMLQGAGYDVVDLGTGCTAEKFYDEYEKNEANVVGMSALLTTTMVYMKTVIDYFKDKKAEVPLIIGGAPINQKYADEIGADGYAKNAYDAVILVDKILEKL